MCSEYDPTVFVRSFLLVCVEKGGPSILFCVYVGT